MHKLFRLCSSLALSSSLLACGSPGAEQTASLQLRLAVEPVPGVVAVRYEVTPVDCTDGSPLAPVITQDVDLLTFALPSISGLESFDPDSRHAFTDALFALPPGCYDVESTPLDEQGDPSATCAPASRDRVEVHEGLTTEIILISQCEGRDVGGLDGVGVLNRPPELVSVDPDNSRFVGCGETARLCVTLTDPDDDPLETVWSPSDDNSDSAAISAPLRQTVEDGIVECVELTPPGAGTYEFTLTVYDLANLSGTPERIEDILSMVGDPRDSHVAQTFEFLSTCDTGPSDLEADLRITSEWEGGYCAVVDVTNTGNQPSDGWTVQINLRQSNFTPSSGYNASFTTQGATLEATSLSWNGELAPDASATFGFCATATGPNPGASVVRAE